MTLILSTPSVGVCSLWSTAHNIACAPTLLKMGLLVIWQRNSLSPQLGKASWGRDHIFPLCEIQTFFFKQTFFWSICFLILPTPFFLYLPCNIFTREMELFMLQFPKFQILPTGSLHSQRNLKHNSEKLREGIYHFVILLYYSRKHTLANSLI